MGNKRRADSKEDLTYAKAVSIAKGFKTAIKNLKEMQAPGKAESSSGSSTGVHIILASNPGSPESEPGFEANIISEPVYKVRVSTAEGGA